SRGVKGGDMTRYPSAVVVVTDAHKKLKRMLAEYFLAEGASVVGLSRHQASLDHPSYRHLLVDVGNDEAVRAAFIEIMHSYGKLDIAVNNAAVLASMHALMLPAASAEQMVRTNLLGTLFVSREAAKIMKKKHYGRIIHIGSMATALDPVGDSIYAATKEAAIT